MSVKLNLKESDYTCFGDLSVYHEDGMRGLVINILYCLIDMNLPCQIGQRFSQICLNIIGFVAVVDQKVIL